MNAQLRIDFLTPYDRKAWPAYFYRDGEEIEIPPQGRIALDNSQACLALARQGMGIYADYALQLKDDLASGRLQRILPDWDMLSWPLFAVYKNEGPPSAAVRAFLDFLEDSCNQVHEDVPAAGKPG